MDFLYIVDVLYFELIVYIDFKPLLYTNSDIKQLLYTNGFLKKGTLDARLKKHTRTIRDIDVYNLRDVDDLRLYNKLQKLRFFRMPHTSCFNHLSELYIYQENIYIPHIQGDRLEKCIITGQVDTISSPILHTLFYIKKKNPVRLYQNTLQTFCDGICLYYKTLDHIDISRYIKYVSVPYLFPYIYKNIGTYKTDNGWISKCKDRNHYFIKNGLYILEHTTDKGMVIWNFKKLSYYFE